MRTASRDMLFIMRRVALSFCVLASSSAFGCSASENFDIYFPKDSAIAPNEEIVRLASWAANQKMAYASHVTGEETLISGHAEEDERHPQILAEARLKAGRALLEQFGFLRGTVKTSARVYSHRDVENGRRVEISFEPDCPNKCCTGGVVSSP